MTKFIGIDLGTTFSAVARLNDLGKPEVLEEPISNKKITASVLYIKKDSSFVVGDEAKKMLAVDQNNIVLEVKKKIHEECVWSIKEGKWIEKNTGDAKITNGEFTPVQITAQILEKVAGIAGGVKKAVVTVPALFENLARERTIEAAKVAGLELIGIIDEPVAAVLHYSKLEETKNLSGRIMVFDLGGGTFDVTIANVVSSEQIIIKGSRGNRNLGGTDFDKKICHLLNDKYKKITGEYLFQEDNFHKFLNAAEQIKRVLSSQEQASDVIDGPKGPQTIEISRGEFEESIEEYLDEIKMLVEDLMEQKELKPSDIDQILLVGGSTRMPVVVDCIKKIMGKEPTKGVDVDQAVAAGAAIYAGLNLPPEDLTVSQQKVLADTKLELVCNHYLGVIAKQKNPQTGRDEDVNVILIPKDSPLPCSKTDTLATRYDGQDGMQFSITQSAIHAQKNIISVVVIKETRLKLPPNLPKGEPVKITYTYDKDVVLHCEFEHEASKKKERISLTPDNSKTVEEAQSEISDFKDFKLD